MIYKKKILLLHKDKIRRERIAAYFRELDFAVLVAQSMDMARGLAESTKPDVILWGEALTREAKMMIRELKDDGQKHKIPVIAMLSDVELFDRIMLEKSGVNDVINDDPTLAELRIKVNLHIDIYQREKAFSREIQRLRTISELQYNLAIVNDIQRLSELLDDHLWADYPFDFALHLVYNSKSGNFDYESVLMREPNDHVNRVAVLSQPVWKDYFFNGTPITPDKITDRRLLSVLRNLKLKSELYYQFPMYAHKKTIGVVIAGLSIKQHLKERVFKDLAVLINNVGHRIFDLRKVYSGEPAPEVKNSAEMHTLFQRYNEEQVFEFLTRQILNKLKTDVCIYFNYNKGFHFLYPQYCFQADSDINLFEDEKPPVLMTRDYPNFEKFTQSKARSVIHNLTKNPAPDLAAMAGLAGGVYNSIVLFSVEIANEVKGYILTANENSMKRFPSALIREAEKLVENAGEVLMESRLVKQAQQTIKQLDRVFALGKDITLEKHIDELLPKIAGAIRRTLGWNIVIIDKRDAHTGRFENVCYYGIQPKVYESIAAKYPDTMYSYLKDRCFKQSNSYFLDHKFVQFQIRESDRHQFEMKIGKEWHDRDWLFIPIKSHGRELGVISVNDPVDRIRPNEEKVRSLEYFANQAAVALENDALYQELKISETKYRALAETMPMGLLTLKDDGTIVYNNRSFAAFMLYSNAESLNGRNIYDFMNETGHKALERYLYVTAHPQEAGDQDRFDNGLEIELLANDNSYMPFKIYLSPSGSKSSASSFIGVLADLRPQKRIERLKSDFNSMVVHDLRSPLNIVQGYIDIVRSKVVGDISEEQAELLGIAKENSLKVLKLVDNFLIASKLEVGQFEVEREVNALNTLIETVFETQRILSDKKQITLSKKLDENIPLLFFDKLRIEQVLTNYMSNAIKFTPEKGTIEVGSRLVKNKHTQNGDSGDEVHVWVRDSGVGIPGDELKKVFNKYEQTEAGKDASLKGTGLGLAICKEIITLHDGKVWVESRENEGATFYFSLPVKKEPVTGAVK
ncbi:MAG TPA: PAS domain S-box protein [Caldithrix abyssi]|uniref:histidine kinase n=1 Tax=Caldithrix abyssi TaxID=187145 RepID=A0A7V1PVS2_CALAY|nr:PAS domain S-box protein [Caldithrix abyssi]